MKARSLVFDLFGDYLRYRGGEVRLRALVSLMGCFDVPEATVRVVVTRLRKEGWLESRRDGRETVYGLSEGAWALLDEGRARIFNRAAGPWDGQWHMVIYSVPETDRALREQLRKRLAWLGFGPLSSSVWLSPHARLDEVRAAFSELCANMPGAADVPGPAGVPGAADVPGAEDVPGSALAPGGVPAARIDTFRSRSAGVASDRDIAARAWDLPALDRDYRDLLETYRPRLPDYRRGALAGAAALVERMHLIHDYRRFPFRDPDLPPELLPDDWSGRRAHEVFLEAHGLLRAPAEACVDALIEAGSGRPVRVD